MAQTLSLSRQAPTFDAGTSARSGGFMKVVAAYIAAQGAAVRTSDRMLGHLQPDERDLKVLGIERTPAYSAVVRLAEEPRVVAR